MTKNKRKIADALLICLEDKQDYEITNNEIIKRAGVSRGTLYNNFTGKHDIANYIFHNIDAEIIRAISKYQLYLSQQQSPQIILNCFADEGLPIIYENRERIRILYKSSLGGLWQDYLERRYLKLIKSFDEEIDDDDFNIRLVVKYALDIVNLWITSPLPTPPEKFKKTFLNLFTIQINSLM